MINKAILIVVPCNISVSASFKVRTVNHKIIKQNIREYGFSRMTNYFVLRHKTLKSPFI
jgi:hypothetical protein